MTYLVERLAELRRPLDHLRLRLERDIMLRWAVEHGLHLAAAALFDVDLE